MVREALLHQSGNNILKIIFICAPWMINLEILDIVLYCSNYNSEITSLRTPSFFGLFLHNISINSIAIMLFEFANNKCWYFYQFWEFWWRNYPSIEEVRNRHWSSLWFRRDKSLKNRSLPYFIDGSDNNCVDLCQFPNCENLYNSLKSKLWVDVFGNYHYIFGKKIVNDSVYAKAYFM